jgi:hypothetical protein
MSGGLVYVHVNVKKSPSIRDDEKGGKRMILNPMTGLWARTALVWFLITICFGMYMGMTEQFHLGPSHAHMGVLGWLSSAVFALLYGVARDGPAGARGPKLHWALHNLGVATMTGALFMMLNSPGGGLWGALIPVGGAIVIAAALWLTAMMWPRLAPR